MHTKTQTEETSARTERRRYPRLQKQTKVLTGKVTYPIDEDNFVTGNSENISLGGILMHTGQAFEEGALVQLKITLPGWHKHHPGFMKVLEDSIGSPMTAICEVLRCEKKGGDYTTAARFINIDPDDFVAFQNYIEKQLNKN